MLVTASTVKDSAENLSFFVAANLASGVDHMLVFLDAPRADGQVEAAALLDDHPKVTCVRAGGPGWWQGDRPANLNHRQRINANWAKQVVAEALHPAGGDAREARPRPWLFHIDGDEVLRVDRARLDAVPADALTVRLAPLEAVARAGATQRATVFKRMLDDDELNLLHVLGAIDAPTNQSYFHGHVMGKSGVRIDSDLALTLHDAVTPSGARVEGLQDAGLGLLHYDAPTDREFIRKWTALAAAGPARYRADRRATVAALRTLAGRDLPVEVREKYLRRIYEDQIADDVELLSDLGLLVEHDPLTPSAARRAEIPDSVRGSIEDRARGLAEVPKQSYLVLDNAKDSAKENAKENAKGARQDSSTGSPTGSGRRRRTPWSRRA